MSDAQDDGVRLAVPLGLLGPWRRWRDSTPGERVAVPALCSVGAFTAGLLSFLLSPVFGDGEGVGSAVFLAAGTFVVLVYLPELTHLWRKIDDGS